MKLSEAMKKNPYPQIVGAWLRVEKGIVHCCPMAGAISVVVSPEEWAALVTKTLEGKPVNFYDLQVPARKHFGNIWDAPDLYCPVCDYLCVSPASLVVHLADMHRTPSQEIATILEGLGQ